MKEDVILKWIVACRQDPERVYKQMMQGEGALDEIERSYVIAKYYTNTGQCEKAEQLYMELLSDIDSSHEVVALEAYIDMIFLKQWQHKTVEMWEYYFKALEGCSNYPNKSRQIRLYTSICTAFGILGMEEESLEALKKIDLEYLRSTKQRLPYLLNLFNLCFCSYAAGYLKEAISYSKLFREEYRKTPIKAMKHVVDLAKAIQHEALGNYEKAITYLERSNTECILVDRQQYVENLKQIGINYKRLQQDCKAVEYLMQCINESMVHRYQHLTYSAVELLMEWGEESSIPRQLLIDLFLNTMKTSRYERKSLVQQNRELVEQKNRLKAYCQSTATKTVQLEEKIETLKVNAIRDPLTGTFNRRYLFQLPCEMNHMRTDYWTFALLDLDYFKQANDTRGHLFGDRVLVELSTYLMNRIGNSGKVFRYGGDEFVLLFEHAEIEGGQEILEHICDKVQGLSFNSLLENNKITLSIGASTYSKGRWASEGIWEVEPYIESCDKLLYKAKRRGKNQLVHQYKIKNEKL